MSDSENDSLLVRTARWLESHVLEFFKTIEGLVLFLIGIIFTPSVGSLNRPDYIGDCLFKLSSNA